MRKINKKSKKYWAPRRGEMLETFNESIEEAKPVAKHFEVEHHLNQTERIGLWLIDELTQWGYQSIGTDPNFNSWRPDTCGCRLIETRKLEDIGKPHSDVTAVQFCPSWEDSMLEVRYRICCPVHQIKDCDIHFAVVLGENQMKNIAMNKIFDFAPEEATWEFVQQTFINRSGQQMSRFVPANEVHDLKENDPRIQKWFRPEIEPKWVFDESRRLIVTLGNEIEWKVESIEEALNEYTGKVLIHQGA